MSKLPVLALCLLLVAAAGCQRSRQATEGEVEALRTALAEAAPAKWALPGERNRHLWAQTRRFYKLREHRPAWVIGGEHTNAVPALRALLDAAGDEGLDPQEYRLPAIVTEEGTRRTRDAVPPEQQRDLELHLTFTLLRYASHLAWGHPISTRLDRNWTVTLRKLDLAGTVQEVLAAGALDSLPTRLAPAQPEYARLREMLQRYRKLAADGSLVPVPAELSEVGADSAGLEALRSNLKALGDLGDQPGGDANVYDENLAAADADFKTRNATQPDQVAPPALAGTSGAPDDAGLREAVRRFEARHGLTPDGVPDAAMLKAMNVPAAKRADQLALNLERWRWLPANLGAPHVVVNIPSFRLQVRGNEDEVLLRMRVIVGTPANRTPVFSDLMSVVVFSPYWNIPQSIEAKEMWPAIIADPGYLERKEIEVVRVVDGQSQVLDPASVDWANAQDAGDIQLRQKPGETNALGFVKFLFPNRFNVYLHDTPVDNLFDRLTRAFSHGCVRLEAPTELATFLLRDQSEWTPERIETAMHSGTEKHVRLEHPLPVHLVYLTAQVGADGLPQFFDDVYGYDQRQTQLRAQAVRRGAAGAPQAGAAAVPAVAH